MAKPAAGDLTERVAFDARGEASDGAGGATTAFVERFACPAAFVRLRGGETVISGRLEGRQPVVIRIRAQIAALDLAPTWRCRDLRRGTVYAVRSVEPLPDRQWIDVLCESGVAA